ncbi:MAG: hypothetical protein U0793_20725 [Gemmataceae bacterium]|mgnify:CR=1 FL=1
MYLVRCEVSEGPRPGYKAIGISSVEGYSEYLVVEERFLVHRDDGVYLPVILVGWDRRQNLALAQLPYEADSGANRVWVSKTQIVPEADEVPA